MSFYMYVCAIHNKRQVDGYFALCEKSFFLMRHLIESGKNNVKEVGKLLDFITVVVNECHSGL